jgi:hypothetical protein
MENFDIYVKTSAMGQAGIHWRHICSDDEQPIKTPTLIQDKILTNKNGYPIIVNDLLDEVKPSLLIYRKNGKILLEVSGIESPERSNRMGSKVLNLIAWIVEDNDENEKIIRKIAYSAIQNIRGGDLAFSRMVQDSINFYEREEFRCDLTKVKNHVDELVEKSNDFDSAENPNTKQLININSDEYLTELGEDIKKYAFPRKWKDSNGADKEDGVLVVVTEQLEQKDIFYLAEVWRGFASNVEKQPIIEATRPAVIISSPSTENDQSTEKKTSVQLQNKSKGRLITLAVIMIILIIVVIVAFQTMKPKMLKPSPQKTTIQQEIREETWHPPLILTR